MAITNQQVVEQLGRNAEIQREMVAAFVAASNDQLDTFTKTSRMILDETSKQTAMILGESQKQNALLHQTVRDLLARDEKNHEVFRSCITQLTTEQRIHQETLMRFGQNWDKVWKYLIGIPAATIIGGLLMAAAQFIK